MVTKVCSTPELYQIQVDLPDNPLKYLNCYVLPHPDRPLIVDTGFNRPECWAALEAGLKELNIDLSHADLFITHLHGDHSGLAPQLIEQGCTAYMHPLEHDYLKTMFAGGIWPHLEKRFAAEGFPPEVIAEQGNANQARLYAAKELFPIVPVQDGDVLTFAGQRCQAIRTPGHTNGHTCLYMPEHEIMFLGDHVLFDITPNITCWLNMTDALGDYLESLDKINTYPVKLPLPGHRKNEMPMDVRVAQIKQHHKDRLQNLLDAVVAHPGLAAYQLAQKLPWSMRGKTWEEFPTNQKWFAMGETLSHVDYLRLRNLVEQREQDGILLYFPTATSTAPFEI